MGTHYLIKTASKPIAAASPFTDLLQLENCLAAQLRRIKVLMGDRVPPSIQFLKPILTGLIAKLQISHFIPERKAESIVVFPKVSGIRISCLQLPVLSKYIPECRPQKYRWVKSSRLSWPAWECVCYNRQRQGRATPAKPVGVHEPKTP
jgi:hypothetical protein